MKSIHPRKVPFLLVGDDKGNISEDSSLEVTGRFGNSFTQLEPNDFIELPEGSELFHLPNRMAVGYNVKKNKYALSSEGWATAAFVAPAYTQTFLSAYKQNKDAVRLPLYAYSAVGWLDNKFYTTAIRVDEDVRQDCELFDQVKVDKNAKNELKKNTDNRLLYHIGHCATFYHCPAARNYFLGRWEMPLPSSPVCNSRCLGCISHQEEETKVASPQIRIDFIPTPQEIIEIAVPHLESAPNPVVSFGQGCEGEPLLVWETLKEAIKGIRKKTKKGIINLNTNGSKPEAVEQLFKAGLQSIRISLNSARKEYYNKYYAPTNYTFEDVVESISIARKYKGWASLNYLTFPGFTDQKTEYNALCNLAKNTDFTMIQWRNFNIDPDWYLERCGIKETPESIGITTLMNEFHKKFPTVVYGYFNPGEVLIAKNLK